MKALLLVAVLLFSSCDSDSQLYLVSHDELGNDGIFMVDDFFTLSFFVSGPLVDKLFDTIEKFLDMRPLAMALSGNVILLSEQYFGLQYCDRSALLGHESIHLRQVVQEGVIDAPLSYAKDWIEKTLDGDVDAYDGLEQEQEAEEYEDEIYLSCKE